MNRDLLAIELQARRLRANLTQAQLARRMSTSQSLIARVEAATVSPGVDVIDRWARATGIPLTLTFGGDTPVPDAGERARLLREAFGPDAFNPWTRDPSEVEQRTLRRLGIDPSPAPPR
jgi:transcriptional regulator with XRE-family HTH domain